MLVSDREPLQTRITLQVFAASIAARRPAMPAPMMSTSVKSCWVDIVSISTR